MLVRTILIGLLGTVIGGGAFLIALWLEGEKSLSGLASVCAVGFLSMAAVNIIFECFGYQNTVPWLNRRKKSSALRSAGRANDLLKGVERPAMPDQITIKEARYYCYKDEESFFRWLESIEGVERAVGGPEGLTLHIGEAGLGRDDWADLIGLFMRYGIDMRELRVLLTPDHEAWLKDPQKYWHLNMWS